jgi:hypothetical protein
MKIAVTFMTVETRTLKALGLERKARDVSNDLNKFLDSITPADNGPPQDCVLCRQKTLVDSIPFRAMSLLCLYARTAKNTGSKSNHPTRKETKKAGLSGSYS